MEQHQREALDHLREAARLLAANSATAHLAARVEAIARGLETAASATADYHAQRGDTPSI